MEKLTEARDDVLGEKRANTHTHLFPEIMPGILWPQGREGEGRDAERQCEMKQA